LNQLAETNTHLSLPIKCLGVKNWYIDCSSSFWFDFPFLPNSSTRRNPKADLMAEDVDLPPLSTVDVNPTHHDRSGSSWRTILTSGEQTRAFISATLNELAAERLAAREAIKSLRLEPVYFGDGARPVPPPATYRELLRKCPIFIGIYWNEYGQLVDGTDISGIEDEYNLSAGKDRLIYIKQPADDRDDRLAALLNRIRDEGSVSYVKFSSRDELFELIANDLARLLAERYEDATATSHIADIPRLPRPLSPFIGRIRELGLVVPRLEDDEIRLLTLTGPGGVGKTRLALQAALNVEGQFADGATFVDLSGVSDPNFVLPTVISTLGQSMPAGQSPAEFLRAYFSEKQFLLLLDNFEHLMDAAPQIADLLRTCPRLKVLVTSRRPLRINGENAYEIEPMELPDPEALPSLADLANIESVALFLQAARKSVPAFQLDAANARTIAEICGRLDGLPLAIELAAARVRMFADPDVLLERLTDRLPLLNLGHRDAPARQQTMRDAIRWSYDLLDVESQKRFRWLSAFAGSITEDAAQFVLGRGGAASIPVLEGLDALVDASLIGVDSGWDGNPRFRMLQTIREFGREQLDVHGERAAAERAVAEYFRDRTHALSERFRSIPCREWFDDLESEMENLRFALAFAQASGDADLLVRLVWHLWRFWNSRGHVREGRAWLDVAVPQSEGLEDHIRHDVAVGAASFAHRQQDYATATELLDRVLTEQRAKGDIELAVGTMLELSSLANSRFDHEQTLYWLTEARELASTAGYQLGVLQADAGFGTLEVNRQHFEEGRTILERVRGDLRELDEHTDDTTLMTCLTHIGRAAQGMGDLDAAIDATTESLALKDQIGETRGRVSTLVSLARMLSLKGDKGNIEKAEAWRAEALQTAIELEVPMDIAEAKLETGRFNNSLPEHERRELLRESLQLFTRLDEPRGITEALEGLAFLDSTTAPHKAVTTYGAVDRLRASIPHPLSKGDSARREQQIAFLRELIGDEAFEATWRTGHEQPIAETVHQVLHRS
jgi:predicted ATPase